MKGVERYLRFHLWKLKKRAYPNGKIIVVKITSRAGDKNPKAGQILFFTNIVLDMDIKRQSLNNMIKLCLIKYIYSRSASHEEASFSRSSPRYPSPISISCTIAKAESLSSIWYRLWEMRVLAARLMKIRNLFYKM